MLADQALEQAGAAEAEIKEGKWRGPLHGIPVGIKDFYDTAGIKTTAGCEFFKDRVPERMQLAVAKLKEAGAILIGKANMHRLGMGTTGLDSYFGPVRNPWSAEYIPGGSSAGSATAVASGMCYATLDTDAIGSCRLPAACCGVVGFKGTYGLINPKGILDGEQDPGEMIRWFSHPGIMARSVEDAALVLDVLAEREHGATEYVDALGKDRKVRIGVADNFKGGRGVSEAFAAAVEVQSWSRLADEERRCALLQSWGRLAQYRSRPKSDRGQAFKDIDVLVLPTMTTIVPTLKRRQRQSSGTLGRKIPYLPTTMVCLP